MDELEKKKFNRFKTLAEQERKDYLHMLEEEMDDLLDGVKGTTQSAATFMARVPLMMQDINFDLCTAIPNGQTYKFGVDLGDLNKDLSQAEQIAYTKVKIFYEQLKAYMDTGIEQSQEVINKAIEEASQALSEAVAGIKESVDGIVMQMEDILAEIQAGIDEVVDQVKDVIDQVKDAIKEFIEMLKEAINEAIEELSALWDSLAEFFRNGFNLDDFEFDFSIFDSDDEIEEEEEEEEEEGFTFGDEELEWQRQEYEKENAGFEFGDEELEWQLQQIENEKKKKKKKKKEKKKETPENTDDQDSINYCYDPYFQATNVTLDGPAQETKPDDRIKKGQRAIVNKTMEVLASKISKKLLGKGNIYVSVALSALKVEFNALLREAQTLGLTNDELKEFMREYLGDFVDTPEFEEMLKVTPADPRSIAEASDRKDKFVEKYDQLAGEKSTVDLVLNEGGNFIKEGTAVLGDYISGAYNQANAGTTERVLNEVDPYLDALANLTGNPDIKESAQNLIYTTMNMPGAIADDTITSLGDLGGTLYDYGVATLEEKAEELAPGLLQTVIDFTTPK